MNAAAELAGDPVDHGISVIIPAHNEESVLPRLLRALLDDAAGLEILVVCNGCTDGSADAARSFPSVRVVELATASKHAAMLRGLDEARGRWTIFLDADVLVSAGDLRRLVHPLESGSALAAGPRRRIDARGSQWPVRAYYDVWERLPQVRDGLFGRGVIALGPGGVGAFRALPPMMSDDLVISECFSPDQRAIVDAATVTIRTPRTSRDLIRRRTRVAMGNTDADRAGLRGQRSRTSTRTLLQIARADPRLAPKVVVFLAIASISRAAARRARRAGDSQWLRDDSSRS